MKRLIIGVLGLGKSPESETGIPYLCRTLESDNIPDTTVLMYKWGTVKDIIDKIAEEKPDYLMGFGHSYGASTLGLVAKWYHEHSVDGGFATFDDLVFTDPVWRKRIDSPQFGSLLRNHKILLYPTIDRFYGFYQSRGLGIRGINGHPVEAVDPAQTDIILWERIVGYGHIVMDQVPDFQELVLNLARGQ